MKVTVKAELVFINLLAVDLLSGKYPLENISLLLSIAPIAVINHYLFGDSALLKPKSRLCPVAKVFSISIKTFFEGGLGQG
jgi:hypothetical protein